MDNAVELLAQILHRNGVVDIKESRAHDVRRLPSPVLDRVFDDIVQGDDQPAEIPDSNDHIGRIDFLDPAPLALDDNDIVNANRLGDCDLQAREKIGDRGLGCSRHDDRSDTGGGEKAGAVVPNARIVEGPEESTDVDDDDKNDDHPAEELELSMDAARPDVVFGAKVVP